MSMGRTDFDITMGRLQNQHYFQKVYCMYCIATSGGAIRSSPPLCSNCDIFSYMYTNTTKLVLHLSCFVRLD